MILQSEVKSCADVERGKRLVITHLQATQEEAGIVLCGHMAVEFENNKGLFIFYISVLS